MKTRFLVCASLLAIGLSGAAQSQDWNAPPAYGSTNLSAGFSDDPRSIDIQMGGAIDASALDNECFGYITHQPSVSVNYQSGSWPLYFSAASDLDGVLVVRAPDGSFHCNDGAFADNMGLNPGVMFENPMSGEYDIWAGALGYGSGYMPGQLHISELRFFNDNRFSRSPDASLPPNAGRMSLRAGFSDDPRTLAVLAGGDMDSDRGTGGLCYGRVSEAPDAWVDYSAGETFDLFFSLESETDTTILVQGPDGGWHCDDDSAGYPNPGVRVRDPQSGRYAVWAGRFSNGPLAEATLYVSELGYLGDTDGPPNLDWSLPSNYGQATLRAGFEPDPYSIDLLAGGDQDVYEAVGDVGNFCRGFATEAPDFDLTYTAGDYDLYISAVTQGDATLIVNAPDGSWWCDDDGAGNLNPGIRFDAPMSGLYNIWVGTYGEVEPTPGTLHISEVGFGDVLGNIAALDHSLPANYGGVDLESGYTPDPHTVELMAGGNLAAEYSADSSCRGYVTAAPDYELRFEAGNAFDLYISAISDADTTLVINDPSGNWVCNDDQIGLNPGVMFSNPVSGTYDIWVGTYWEGEPAEAVLEISELGFGGQD